VGLLLCGLQRNDLVEERPNAGEASRRQLTRVLRAGRQSLAPLW
jgi:hypothetical protein